MSANAGGDDFDLLPEELELLLPEFGLISDSLPSKDVVLGEAINNLRELMKDQSCEFKVRLDASCALINIASQILR